jgi:hypothetical protein
VSSSAAEDPRGPLRHTVAVLRAHVEDPAPPPHPSRRLERLLYGFAQPLWGLKTMVRRVDLLGVALAPVLIVAAVCALVAWSEAEGQPWWRIAAAFFVAFAGLAPLPPILFQRTYARLSARIRNDMGLGPREPYLRGVGDSIVEAICMVVVIAIGVAPLVALLGAVPTAGPAWAAALNAAWILHWIVVEAFDGARTLAPGQAVEDAEKEGRAVEGRPWFSRPYHRPMPPLLRFVLTPFRIAADVAARVGGRWRPEVDRVERQPWIALGFGLGTALLLAIPGVNLFFRPAVILGAAHLSGRLDLAEAAGVTLGPTGTRPFPVVPP